jgi:hypothetical protein
MVQGNRRIRRCHRAERWPRFDWLWRAHSSRYFRWVAERGSRRRKQVTVILPGLGWATVAEDCPPDVLEALRHVAVCATAHCRELVRTRAEEEACAQGRALAAIRRRIEAEEAGERP